MGWKLSIKETKQGTKYKIWSTIVDAYINDKWLNREEMMKFFFWHRFRDFASKFIEDTMTFPNGYIEKGQQGRIFDEVKSDEYYKFMSNYNDEQFYGKFIEEIDRLGIKISVSDNKWKIEN